jgi:hypothetical protein
VNDHLLGRKEINRFMQEVAGHADLDETFAAWNFDSEEIAEWVSEMTMNAVFDMLRYRNPQLTIATAYLIGLEIGYKLCLENELRRIAHE